MTILPNDLADMTGTLHGTALVTGCSFVHCVGLPAEDGGRISATWNSKEDIRFVQRVVENFLRAAGLCTLLIRMLIMSTTLPNSVEDVYSSQSVVDSASLEVC